jgi:iron(III) transport system substrate-binding protein
MIAFPVTVVAGAMAAAWLAANAAAAETDLALYAGADREARLVAASQAEGGEVLWYADLAVDQAIVPILKAFRARYDWTKPGYVQEGAADMARRLVDEYRERRYAMDVVDVHPAIFNALNAAGTLRPFAVPGGQALWAESHRQAYVIAFNTSLIGSAAAPAGYEDLLDARWMGHFGIGGGQPGGVEWIGGLLTSRGDSETQRYLERLAAQKPRVLEASPRELLDLVVTGDLPIALVLDSDAEREKAGGAPVDWRLPTPAILVSNVVALGARAPHPATAALLIDFLLSAEGQALIAEARYRPAPPTTSGGVLALAPDQQAARTEEWTALFRHYFGGQP